jgi:hypothetical protein
VIDEVIHVEGIPIVPFIRVNRRDNFLLKEIPHLHPESMEYTEFWREHKRRCIEGFWSPDDADVPVDTSKKIDHSLKCKGWRWMPQNLYFYVNLGTILHNNPSKPKTAPKEKMRPYLRDVEWEFFYNFMEARGFSGFSDDKVYTCYAKAIEPDFSIAEYKHSCYDQFGNFLENKWLNVVKEDNKTIKEYIPARKYMRKLHDKPMGLPMYENQALNMFMLGARGFGKSYMVGVGIVLHEVVFDGARAYTQESINNPYKVEVFVGAAISSKSADILDKTKTALEELPGDWEDGDEYIPSPLYKSMAGSLRPNNMKNPWRHEYEKKIGGAWRKLGTKSNVKHGIYTTENPEAAAGTRPGIMVVEEVGLCSNILTVHGSNTACMMEGSEKFGTAVYLGTGGNMEKIQESETIFRDPKGFDFVAYTDPEKEGNHIGWFVPIIYGLNQYKDENGNTDIEAAVKRKLEDRKKKQLSKDSSAIDLEMMNYPLIPSEMFLSKKGNIFPISYLQERLGELESDEKYINAEYHGKLVAKSDGTIEWELDAKLKPLYNFPVKESDKVGGNVTGNLVIYEHPYEDENNDVPYGRYIAGCDPYDHDKAGTTSLGSTIMYDRLTKTIVAEYTGRPDTAKDYYEVVRRMLKYYNARLLYENERKGIYDYFESMNCVYLLLEQPEIIKDVLQNTRVQRNYGMHMNGPLKRYGEELIKSWLIEAFDDKEKAVMNLHKIRSFPLLKELIRYNDDGNFDRVMAFMMVMYFILEVRKHEVREKSEIIRTDKSNDPFFNRGGKVRKLF